MSKTAEVKKLQEHMETMPQCSILVEHYFSSGLYGRLMTMNAGETVVGKVHKQKHFAILLEGEVIVSSKYGTAVYAAPYIITSEVGDKRAFVAKTTVKWLTIHATTETDIPTLEQVLVED